MFGGRLVLASAVLREIERRPRLLFAASTSRIYIPTSLKVKSRGFH